MMGVLGVVGMMGVLGIVGMMGVLGVVRTMGGLGEQGIGSGGIAAYGEEKEEEKTQIVSISLTSDLSPLTSFL